MCEPLCVNHSVPGLLIFAVRSVAFTIEPESRVVTCTMQSTLLTSLLEPQSMREVAVCGVWCAVCGVCALQCVAFGLVEPVLHCPVEGALSTRSLTPLY